MTTAKRIADKIEKLPKDRTFGYADLPISPEEFMTAAKAIERLQKKGVIKKLSKGVFYKPEITVFGELKPSDNEVLRPYLFQDGKRVAYLTGASLYNYLMLSTQIPAIYQIASADKRIYINRGKVRAKPVKSYAPVTDKNYKLLGLLDAMKDLNRISDVNRKSAILIFLSRLREMKMKKLNELVNYALLYPPRARALLGALLEQLDKGIDLKRLKDSLNPLSTYTYYLQKSDLTTQQNWNII